jgi:hypothetical protein
MGAVVVVVDHERTVPIISPFDHVEEDGSLVLIAPASAIEVLPENRDHPAWQHKESSAGSAHARPYVTVHCRPYRVHRSAVKRKIPLPPSECLSGVHGTTDYCYEVQVGVDHGRSLRKRLSATMDPDRMHQTLLRLLCIAVG